MGVHSLWEILGPSARTVRLEALSRKKLAVDASIWIYQFLKAVRDKEGKSLRNSHIVGFFRRICKLLYFGIQPVFVFDGGAPSLKRKTILRRKERRRDKLETLQRTAQKLLAMQLQKKANDEYKKESSPKKYKTDSPKDEKVFGDLEFENYFEDNDYLNTAGTNVQTDKKLITPKKEKVFRKDDDYHLPEVGLMQTNDDDQRMITDFEFKRLTEGLEYELEGIDLDNIDPTSETFQELPLATQYMVLSHLRLRSRLRMGYTKEQLETLFPNRMDFSKFQISMVQKRNYLTQRLMNINGMDNVDILTTRRIAGEKGREYQLMKNDDGYTLSLGLEGNAANKPIILDEIGNVVEDKSGAVINSGSKSNDDEDDEDDDLEFEDVGLDDSSSKPLILNDNDGINIDLLFYETEKRMRETYKQSESYESTSDIDKELKRLILFHSISLASDSKSDKKKEQSKMPSEKENQSSPSSPVEEVTAVKELITIDALPPNPASSSSQLTPDFSFKNSMLFGSKKLNKPQQKIIEDVPKYSSEAPRDTGKKLDGSNERKTSSPSKDVKKNSLPAPEWFGKSQVGFGKNNPYITDYSIYSKDNNKTKDEEIGLISLEQARDIIEEAEEEEENTSGEDNNSDFEIIENPNKPKEAVSSAPLDGLKKRLSGGKAENLVLPVLPAIDYDFSESEEEDLIEQLQLEEYEHERFASTLNNTKAPPSWSLDDEKELNDQRRKDRRDADEVTQGMIQDVQELLSRFGIPFITAPMEAEAQCAELYELGLVDGIITDDSDCFLFGGNMVYKNMFSEKNYVECYIMEDIERDFGLNRTRLIELALLLGSDYTDGLKGIGKVTAMEILADFQNGENESPLINFRNWWLDYQKGAKIDPTESSIKKKLRKSFQKKLFLDMGFPEPLVVDAYMKPEVDSDKTEFKWGAPDLDRLRTFLMYNIGWSQQKVDEVLVPVIRDINKKQQSTISEFFPREFVQTRKELMVGKRLKDATKKLTTNKKQKR